jgi:hypothetical protein
MLAVLALGGIGLAAYGADEGKGDNKVDERVFELRIYHAAAGKMKALNTRFREHTNKLFKKHGMTIIAFWQPTGPDRDKKLIYVLAFPGRAAADKSWKAFRDDPEWKAAKAASEKDGTLVDKVESVFMKPTDYSPIK